MCISLQSNAKNTSVGSLQTKMVLVCVGQNQSHCANFALHIGVEHVLLIQKLVHLGQSFQYTDEIPIPNHCQGFETTVCFGV